MSNQPHDIYIGELRLPVTPAGIDSERGNRNDTIDLLNGEQYNIIKKPGLKEWEFDILLPHEKIPAATYFIEPQKVIDKLEEYRDEEEKIKFVVIRHTEGLQSSAINTATVEEVGESENTENGRDIKVHVRIKEYNPLKTEKLTVKENEGGTLEAKSETITESTEKKEKSYTIKEGDTAAIVAQKIYKDTSKATVITFDLGQPPNQLKPGVKIEL